MPSACVKVEKQEAVLPPESDPIKQMLNLIEKKIRNLEKRKVRLDDVRKKKDSGEELNGEQKEALDKYELVLQSIEFVKELQKGVQQQVAENEKQAKKQQKKEKSEKMALEQRRFRELLAVQALLNGLGDAATRADFRHGTNGAVLLSDDELTQLDSLYKLISPAREENTNFAQQLSVAAEHIVCLLDGRDKPIATTTYRELAAILRKIEDCGYFDRPVTTTNTVTDSQPTLALVTESINVLPHATVTVPENGMAAPVMVTMYNGSQSAAYSSDAYYTTTQTSHHYDNGRPIQDIVTSGPFNFIQESEIDPAVADGAVAYLPQSVYNSAVLVSQPPPIFADPSHHMDVPYTTVLVPAPIGVTSASAVIMPHYQAVAAAGGLVPISHVTAAGMGGGIPVSAMQPIAAETLEAVYAVADTYVEQAATEHQEKKPFTMNPEANEFQSMYTTAGITFGTESQVYVNSSLTDAVAVNVVEVQHVDGDVQQEDDEQEWHSAGGYRNGAGQRGGARGYSRGGYGRGSRRGGGGGFRGRGFYNPRGGRGGYQNGYGPRNDWKQNGSDFESGRPNGGSFNGRGRGSYRNGGDKEVSSPASSSEASQQQQQ